MKKIILAGVCLKESQKQFQEKMDECIALAEACNLEVADTITQKSDSMDTRFAFHSGKLEELRVLVQYHNAELVVFLNTLTVQSAKRIAEACECEVIDRTALILDIFSKRARSKQAKLQTEMARLRYDLPRVLASDNDTERERGGVVNNRGSGEMRSQIIARKYQRRIQDLKEELEKIEIRRTQDERRRNKTMIRRVALVGYTNAGKSSLMNCLLKETNAIGNQVYEEDMLFATLDTSVRNIESRGKSFLLYDTVGFVSDLPHTLIDAFKSTLSAAKDADLLIHVIDVSDPDYEKKISVTNQTLQEIGAGEIPVLRVFNKVDLLNDTENIAGLCVSCRNETNIEKVLDKILELLYPEEENVICHLPYDKIYMFDEYKKVLNIEMIDCDEEGMHLSLKGPHRYIKAFEKYQIEGE